MKIKLYLIKKVVISAVIAMSPVSAMAVTFTETTDLPGSSGFSVFNASAGVLDVGINTISGSLLGECFLVAGGCNSGSGAGDTQDSILIEIASGFEVESLFVTTSNVSGPLGFRASFSLRDPTTLHIFESTLPLDSTSGDLVILPLASGIYSLSIFGQSAFEAGLYSLDYSLEVNVVSAVPVPAAAWLFGSGLIGLIGIARTKKS